jgi:hypothetical protein
MKTQVRIKAFPKKQRKIIVIFQNHQIINGSRCHFKSLKYVSYKTRQLTSTYKHLSLLRLKLFVTKSAVEDLRPVVLLEVLVETVHVGKLLRLAADHVTTEGDGLKESDGSLSTLKHREKPIVVAGSAGSYEGASRA